ncbi:MFS transporter [Microbacterium sp. 179-B 1A2 NHS]|uniref:MFS transporter n=1 Tax=Microbacterium sp. 179-B 1A2 NHS TaxID=3142383 RepID=UPI0039A3B6A8
MTTPIGGWRARVMLASLALAGVVAALMQTLVLPLLPLFPGWLDVTSADAQWIATSTMLAGAIGAPLFGWLGDRYGLARMIVAALVLLSIGSAVSALSDSLGMLLLGRTLQGFSSGVMGLALAVARTMLAPASLPWAVGIVSGTLGIGTGLGVPLAGLVLEVLPWQGVFWIAAAAGLASAGLVALLVPHRRARASGTFDFTGAAVFSGILLLVLVPLSMIGRHGVTAASVVSWLAAAIAAAWWVRHELRTRSPFVDVRLARLAPIASSHVTALFVGIAFFLSFTGTVYLTQMPTADGVGLGGGVLLTGLVQTPASLASIAAAPLATFIATRWGARNTVAAGALGVAAASASRMLVLDDVVLVSVCTLLVSGSASFTFAAMPLILMDVAPLHATGAVNGLNIMMRQVGSAIAGVIGAIILAVTADQGAYSRSTFDLLFGIGAACGLVAAAAMLPWQRRPPHPLPSPADIERASR